MMKKDTQNWETLLLELYENERSRFKRDYLGGYLVPENNSVGQESKLSRQELSDAVRFLSDAKMLKPDGEEWILTEKGSLSCMTR